MDMFRVGKIFNTHGLKGEVRVKQTSDFEERFHEGNTLYYQDDKEAYIALTVRSFRIHKGALLLEFEGINDINDVLFLKDHTLYIKAEQLTDLDNDEYYYHEIIGCEMVTTTGEVIGIVDAILSPGANDVWVVKGKNNEEILIPYIEPVVKDINVPEKKIIIELMEGLIE